MRPDNLQLTATDNRFAYPRFGIFDGDILHHESFVDAEVPTVEVLEGQRGFVFYLDSQHTSDSLVAMIEDNRVPAGALVRDILVTSYQTAGNLWGTDNGIEMVVNQSTGRYAVQDGDRLILRPMTLIRKDGELMRDILGLDEEGSFVHPAESPLPFASGGQTPGRHDNQSAPLRYEIVGVITGDDNRLISWQNQVSHGGGTNARRLVDMSVINSVVETPLELALLRRALRGASLLGQITVSTAARVYLENFDRGRFMPTAEPRAHLGRIGFMNENDLRRYSELIERYQVQTPEPN